ncbi:MAG TPA: PrsW family glutamic-type intramembrane protease [Ktedonobacteraceae bacterium]|nr:PrsW family glutamic-type intramembrane protease [Ktedonobacteraceae bacterium]
MNHQHYGVLRVVRMLANNRSAAEPANAQGKSSAGWLPTEGLVHLLTRKETTIGRALNNDVILLDPTVSREHAHLLLNEHGWRITNLTEQNTVRVNGRPVPFGSSLPVRPQDILVLGSTMLQLIAPQNHLDQLLPIKETQDPSNKTPHPKTISVWPSSLTGSEDHNGALVVAKTPESLPILRYDENDSNGTGRYDTPLPPLPETDDDGSWNEEGPESVLGAGITLQFALPQRMGSRTRWLIAGVGITILVISAMITIILNSVIGISALEQNGIASIVTALTIPLIPAVGIFLLVNFMDRFEREPWFLRLAAFFWGAIIAIPPALFIETQVNTWLSSWLADNTNNILIHALYRGLNAGITEETIKGLGLILLLIILRDEFDNVTDGVVYGALIGAGFAMVENFGYFASNGDNFLAILIVGRIILGWLGHSTFIACFGAALGYIRHTRSHWKQIIIPLIGFLLAVGMHSFFDFVDFYASEMIRTMPADSLSVNYALAAIIGNYIPPFLAQMGLLYILIKSLAHEAAVIREFLAIEVINGVVTVDEYALLQNSFQRTRRERRVLRRSGVHQWLRVKALYQTEIGLAFRKWHVSMGDKPKLGYRQPEDAYRERIRRLRHEIQAADPGS